MIAVPPSARPDPAFGNMPAERSGGATIVYDVRFGIIHVVPDGGGYVQFESNEALGEYLRAAG